MKKQLKIIYIFTQIILYCFFISSYNQAVVTSDSSFSNTAGHENFTAVSLSNHAHDAEQTESLINVCKNIPRTTFKNPFNQFSFLSLATIGAIYNSYIFYIFYSDNLFIRFSKTDIIFPFHNFW